MFCRPIYFYEYLAHHDLVDDMYKAMESPDLAVTVMTALNILKKTKKLPGSVKQPKSESVSTTYRKDGNQCFVEKKYQNALINYNKALLHAPTGSQSMKLAYSNRSALLLQMRAPTACIKDIEILVSLGCPQDIIEKVRRRKKEARIMLCVEKIAGRPKVAEFVEKFFQFKVKRNPQISCASTDVGVIVENQVPKIVATTDVKVGTVLAVETAFVSVVEPQNAMFTCYYCHKMDLNLKPCNTCCNALFCDEKCRNDCMREYHGIECTLVDTLEFITSGALSRLAFNAFIKMKYMSTSWKELIEASYLTGLSRVKASSINEIYDCMHKFSLLSFKDERHMLNGALYNYSFCCAAIIHYLEECIPGFFPQSGEGKVGAQQATARILMYLTLYATNTQLIDSKCVMVEEDEIHEIHNVVNFGWFSFLGKLSNSCLPNVLTVGLNKQIGLVALTPIKKGTELKISYVGHWLAEPEKKFKRHQNMFNMYHVVCNCMVCTHEYKKLDNNQLTEIQKRNFDKLNVVEMCETITQRNIQEIFTKLCKMLALLSDVPFSEEYAKVYEEFRKCMIYLQHHVTQNVILKYV